jgi:NAD-dependent deacetylase
MSEKKMIVVFSGAGMSADSGIPTFRFGTDGLWENHKIEEIANHDAYFKNKEKVLQFYADRFNQYKDCKPHAGHKALVELEEKYNVCHLTQNIDNLLEDAGATNVRHLHGNIFWRKCEWHQDIISHNEQFKCNHREPQTEATTIEHKCPKCGGQMRPDVVLFGENAKMPQDYIEGLIRVVKEGNGVFICAGTALQAFPASYIVPWFGQVERKYLIDIRPTKMDGYQTFKGSASKKLVELAEDLLYL